MFRAVGFIVCIAAAGVHLVQPGRPTRLYRALGPIVLACLALLALSRGR